jgi:hypothetical protein
MADIPMVTVPVAAHEGNRLVNWLISQINVQAAGGTPTAYTNWIGGGGTGTTAIPATEGITPTSAEAPKEETQPQEQQQQHASNGPSTRRGR